MFWLVPFVNITGSHSKVLCISKVLDVQFERHYEMICISLQHGTKFQICPVKSFCSSAKHFSVLLQIVDSVATPSVLAELTFTRVCFNSYIPCLLLGLWSSFPCCCVVMFWFSLSIFSESYQVLEIDPSLCLIIELCPSSYWLPEIPSLVCQLSRCRLHAGGFLFVCTGVISSSALLNS